MRERCMIARAGLVALFCLSANGALAGSTSGSSALALTALVAATAPTVKILDRVLLLAYLEGRADAAHAKGETLVVKADAIDCRAGNVDIASHVCDLTFGPKKSTLSGRKAHELYATLIESGVAPDGAAGATHASVTALDCTVSPDEVQSKAGGGARCSFSN